MGGRCRDFVPRGIRCGVALTVGLMFPGEMHLNFLVDLGLFIQPVGAWSIIQPVGGLSIQSARGWSYHSARGWSFHSAHGWLVYYSARGWLVYSFIPWLVLLNVMTRPRLECTHRHDTMRLV